MTEGLRTLTYPALQVESAAWKFKFISFFAEAGDLFSWCGVYNKKISQEGYQRILHPKHAVGIKKFLNDPQNMIPNSLVIAFNDEFTVGGTPTDAAVFRTASGGAEYLNPSPLSAPDGKPDAEVKMSVGYLEVRVHPECVAALESGGDPLQLNERLSAFRSAYMIDGQHRVNGANQVNRNVYLPVSAFVGVDTTEQAFQFIVINHKARRVSKHDIDAVIPEKIHQDLQKRLREADISSDKADVVYALDNDSESPFVAQIVWSNNKAETAVIPKGAIDGIIEYAADVYDEYEDDLNGIDEFLIPIWRAVKGHLGDEIWSKKKVLIEGEHYQNQFLVKAAAVLPAIQLAINKAIQADKIQVPSREADFAKRFEESVREYLVGLPSEFFFCVWDKKSITNEASIEDLSILLQKAVARKAVPYEDKKIPWLKKPVSDESLKQSKAKQKKIAKKGKRSSSKK